jgi:hypothetical protein
VFHDEAACYHALFKQQTKMRRAGQGRRKVTRRKRTFLCVFLDHLVAARRLLKRESFGVEVELYRILLAVHTIIVLDRVDTAESLAAAAADLDREDVERAMRAFELRVVFRHPAGTAVRCHRGGGRAGAWCAKAFPDLDALVEEMLHVKVLYVM